MKSKTFALITAMTVFAALAIPLRLAAQRPKKEQPQQYTVTDLGTLGGTLSVAFGISNKHLVNGASTLPGGQVRAFLWKNNVMMDLGTLGGPNSDSNFPLNDRGDVAGFSDTTTPDPLGENFCGFGTHLICLPFLWRHGVMTPLPTLGGNNGQAFEINNRGQIAGFAENTTHDPTCVAPQVLQSKPVIFEKGEIQELPTLSGDPDGQAVAINDEGQLVGGSGNCASVNFHALLWQRHDEVEAQNEDRDHFTVTNLGNLGGTMGNFAEDINNDGQVVGASDLPGDTTGHAFLWTKEDGIQDLGTLHPGDLASVGFGINSEGQVAGTSFDASNTPHAFLWQRGVMTDLNSLIPASSSLFLLDGFAINDRGEIVGDALQTSTGEVHAYLATPCDEERGDNEDCKATTRRGETSERPTIALPENVRKLLRQRLSLRYHTPSPGPGPTD